MIEYLKEDWEYALEKEQAKRLAEMEGMTPEEKAAYLKKRSDESRRAIHEASNGQFDLDAFVESLTENNNQE